jgi:hypothetical protein
MDFELVTPFCGLEMEDRTVRIFYQEIKDLAREYFFGSEQDAQDFYNATTNLALCMKNVPEGKESIIHLLILELMYQGKEYEMMLRKANPKAAIEAS